LNSIKTLLKLEFTLNKNLNANKQKKNKLFFFSYVFTFVFMLLISFVFLGGFYFIGGEDKLGQLSLFITIMQVILFFYALSNILKRIFNSKDKPLLAYLPVSKWHIYMAKSIYILFKTYILNFTIFLPTLIIFAILYKMNVTFYLLTIFVILFLPLLPFGLALIVSTPMMYVQNWLKNKNVLNLILSIILTVIGFYFYSKVIFAIADIVFLEKVDSGNLLINIANVFTSIYFPSTWFANVLLIKNILFSLLAILLFSILTFVGGYALGSLSYNKIFNDYMVQKTYARHIKTTNKVKKPFLAFFLMEFKELFRSSAYSYTYFGMAVAMPIMVWICNKFMLSFAVERIGENMVFGTTLLVVLVFISMICSPTASFISKEGESFWIIKTNPKGITTPLFAKSLVGVLASTFALISTFIILIAFRFITVVYGVVILAIAILYMIGLIALGLFINLLKPNLFKGNQENNFNMVILLLISFVISIALGVVAIILTFGYSITLAITTCMLSVVVFAIAMLILLLTTYSKLYRRIEV